ncbi:glycoside hydrolase/deacetylase [Hymenopellis radicata]|nr:glycoside hydrolase/deacetylase [Hymenopellis radicata]
MLRSLPLLLAFASSALSHSPIHLPGRRTGTWYQERDHPVHGLFKRISNDGTEYPEVGSSTWSAAYPTTTPDPAQMPQAWKDALDAAVKAGKIPDIPPSTSTGGSPTYPNGLDPMSAAVCSATYKCRNPDDVWDAPDGHVGIGFDDGPAAGTTKLIQFLTEQDETATHFLIGINIRNEPDQFLAILEQGGDIAVHTYTHPYMTTQTNEQVVAQLGWTMEIIHNSTGGRVPKFWRPPYGDSDNRVRAIAEEIFGMKVIIWNQDTEDWSMATNGTTMQAINASMTQWITGPKSPGLIILEHELTDDTVQAFMDAFPVMKSNGWETKSVALLSADSAYQNSAGTGDGTTVTPDSILLSTDNGDNGSNDNGGNSSSSNSGSGAGAGAGSGSGAGSTSTSTTTTRSSTSTGTSAAASATTSGNSAPHIGLSSGLLMPLMFLSMILA